MQRLFGGKDAEKGAEQNKGEKGAMQLKSGDLNTCPASPDPALDQEALAVFGACNDDEPAVVHEAEVLRLDVAVEEAIGGEALVVKVSQRDRELERELQRSRDRPAFESGHAGKRRGAVGQRRRRERVVQGRAQHLERDELAIGWRAGRGGAQTPQDVLMMDP